MRGSIKKYGFALTAMFLLLLPVFQGCAEPKSGVLMDKITVTTRPEKISKELREVGLCYDVTGTASGGVEALLCDYSGLDIVPTSSAFEEGMVPSRLFDGDQFFFIKDDPANFETRMVVVSRKAYKRTDIVYNHLLKIAGQPLLNDDSSMIAAGIQGWPEEGKCYLALLDLVSQTVGKVLPPGYADNELEGSTTMPVAWEGDTIHAVLFLENGKAVYFVADKRGDVKGTVELPGGYKVPSTQPTGWRLNTRAGKPFLVSLDDGYLLVDDTSWKANRFKLDRSTRLLGVTDDSRELVLASYDKDSKRPAIYWRHPIGGDAGKPLPFGRGAMAGIIGDTFFSTEENCIFFTDDNDIWRMDLNSGVQGKMFDTPTEKEKLLWVW